MVVPAHSQMDGDDDIRADRRLGHKSKGTWWTERRSVYIMIIQGPLQSTGKMCGFRHFHLRVSSSSSSFGNGYHHVICRTYLAIEHHLIIIIIMVIISRLLGVDTSIFEDTALGIQGIDLLHELEKGMMMMMIMMF